MSVKKFITLEYFGNRTLCLSKVFSIFPYFVLVKKKTLQKAKKLFKVSLLSLSKDSLVNCFWENLSFCQFILV